MLFRPSHAMVFSFGVFLPEGDFVEGKPLQATESLEKGCFSRIADGTFGSFFAWFWN